MASSSKEELPSGGWVELRDPNWLRARDRNQLIRQVTSLDDSMPLGDKAIHTLNALAALMIVDWKLPYEPEPTEDGTTVAWSLPKTNPDILEELTAPDAARLQELLEPAQRVLMPTRPSPDDHADPHSPFGLANESEHESRAQP